MLDRTPEIGHGKAAPGWFLMFTGFVIDFLSRHGMEVLSASAIVTGIVYHLVLIYNARAKHRLEEKALEAITAAAQSKAATAWPGLLNYDQLEGKN